MKDCPKGTELYITTYGKVELKEVDESHPLLFCRIEVFNPKFCKIIYLNEEGKCSTDGECLLFPSKEQRDWSKWQCPKLKKPKFDPKTLQAFDKVLARHKQSNVWFPDFYSFCQDDNFATIGNGYYNAVIPYNEETKHIVGTTDEAPDFYKYWEE